MKRTADSSAAKVGILIFAMLTLFVVVVRPLTRPAGHLYARFGLTRMSLLSESAEDDTPSLQPPTEGGTQSLPTILVVGTLLLVLKTRRIAFRTVPLRRAKRPPRRTFNSLSSDQQ